MDRRLHHCQPGLGVTHITTLCLLPGHVGHHEQHPVQAKLMTSSHRHRQMGYMNGVKGATEQSDALGHVPANLATTGAIASISCNTM